MADFPTMLPAFMGEWDLQHRDLSATGQRADTLKRTAGPTRRPRFTSATSATTASKPALGCWRMIPGYVIRLQDKNDQTIWSTFIHCRPADRPVWLC